MSPPRVLVGEGGWTQLPTLNTEGRLGSSWTSAYDHVLAEHYDWLARFQPRPMPDGWDADTYSLSPAVHVPARGSGTAYVWFSAPESAPQVTDPGDVILGMIYLQGPSMDPAKLEGYIRWARRIYG